MVRYVGRVSAKYEHRKYGFIECPAVYKECGKHPFVLLSELHNLNIGDDVTFLLQRNTSGPKAVLVQAKRERLVSGSICQPFVIALRQHSGLDALDMYVGLLIRAKTSVRMSCYGIGKEILQHVREAAERGVHVRVIVDAQHQNLDSRHPRITPSANLDVIESKLKMHAKTMLVDADDPSMGAMVTGSANPTLFSHDSIEYVQLSDLVQGESQAAAVSIKRTRMEFDALWDWFNVTDGARA